VEETPKGSGFLVTVYPARINCNQKSQTIEEIQERRKQDFIAMAFYLAQELARDLPQIVEGLCPGLSDEQTKALNQRYKKLMDGFKKSEEEWQAGDAKEFNSDSEYKTRIVHLIEFKHTSIVELGKHVYKTDAGQLNEDNLVHVAAKKGHVELIKTLISLRFASDTPDKDGKTPLMYASLFGQVDAVRVLLDKSATLEKDDKDGTTPLMYASQCGSAEVVRVLLGKGARLEAADRGGKMALQYAAENKHSEVVGVLIEAGLAAGQDANACYSVISVYLCMGVCS
jgi:hypothetical protein